jgi:hypothetical protein
MGWIDIGERVSNDMGSGERDTVELARAVAIPGARAPSAGILLSGPRASVNSQRALHDSGGHGQGDASD